MPESLSTTIKIRKKDYVILKQYCKNRGLMISEVVSRLIGTLEAKKLESEEKEGIVFCDRCKEEVPIDSSFCPYCGIKFAYERPADLKDGFVDEDDEESNEDETEDETEEEVE